MTAYWVEHAWLPTGLATEVRFEEWRSRPIVHKLIDGAAFLLRREL